VLDRRFVADNIDLITENCRKRGADADVARFAELDRLRRQFQADIDRINQQAGLVSKSIGKAADAAERDALKAEGRRLREEVAVFEAKQAEIVAESDAILRAIPNLTHPSAPTGGEDAAVEFRRGKTPLPQFSFKPLDHVDLGASLKLFDFDAGAKVAGHGFYFLTNDGVLLELALTRYCVDLLQRKGFTVMTTPDLARDSILEGTGFMPRGPETQIYSITGSDLSLVATAEITLGGAMHERIFEAAELPLRLCGISHCFRTEAGAHGRATRGLYRVHQFTKVEMFAFTLPEQSDGLHQELLELECELFDGLGIPYRVIDTPSGDLGGPAYRKFDLEAWMPGRGEKGEWGEVTSTSNCTDYQARRLAIRYRKPGEKGTHFVHTLNGTAIAMSRAIIAIVENYQQADGSVTVPEALVAWMGKRTMTPPVAG
jgi:seryl-tRNA synthetase